MKIIEPMWIKASKCYNDCTEHEGWRHPDSVGDIFEALLCGVPVLDRDADVVLWACTGIRPYDGNRGSVSLEADSGWQEDSENLNRPIITYGYTQPQAWNGRITYGLDVISTSWRSLEGQRHVSSSANWANWLIAKMVTDEDIAEVRKSLGMEK